MFRNDAIHLVITIIGNFQISVHKNLRYFSKDSGMSVYPKLYNLILNPLNNLSQLRIDGPSFAQKIRPLCSHSLVDIFCFQPVFIIPVIKR